MGRPTSGHVGLSLQRTHRHHFLGEYMYNNMVMAIVFWNEVNDAYSILTYCSVGVPVKGVQCFCSQQSVCVGLLLFCIDLALAKYLVFSLIIIPLTQQHLSNLSLEVEHHYYDNCEYELHSSEFGDNGAPNRADEEVTTVRFYCRTLTTYLHKIRIPVTVQYSRSPLGSQKSESYSQLNKNTHTCIVLFCIFPCCSK